MREFMKNKKIFFNYRVNTLIILTLTALLFQGCLDDDESDLDRQVRLDDEAITEYLESNNIEAERDPYGYYFVKTKENRAGEEVEDGDVLSIYYTMTLLNGNEIDSASATRGGAVKIGFDQSRITMAPSGLYVGLSTMREGEIYKFFIPSYRAYGSYSYKQLIPANAIFIIDVELVNIGSREEQEEIEIGMIEAYLEEQEVVDADNFSSGLFYKQLSAGDGAKPGRGDNLRVHYKGTYLDGTVFDQTESNSPFEFTLGSTSVIEGFEEGIELMQEGEKALLIMPSNLAYGESFQVVPAQIREDLIDKELIRESVEPFSPLIFEVELVDVN